MSRQYPIDPEQVRQYFEQFRGQKLIKNDDHLNGNENNLIQYKHKISCHAHATYRLPNGEIKNKKQIEFTPFLLSQVYHKKVIAKLLKRNYII
jgi:hypothetical protein